MNKDIAIKVENLSKVYKLYNAPIDRMKEALNPFKKSYHKEFYALNDVSFEIKKGDCVGIIGKNGAGKSTLLKIITGVLSPTSGYSNVVGRVSALLELGAGFNPEYTGMENIFFQGNLMGISEDEMSLKLNDILSFADIGDFIYQPVKTYSSGMFARLAFAVAINVDPDILIVDEALSVGDSMFQHKCMARMNQIIENGATVLFVSHSIESVRSLCSSGIWLENGSVRMIDKSINVVNEFLNEVFINHNKIALENIKESKNNPLESKDEQNQIIQEVTNDVNSTSVLNITRIYIENSNGNEATKIYQEEYFYVCVELEMLKDIHNLSVGFLIKDQFGLELTGESVFNAFRQSLNLKSGDKKTIKFSAKNILRGGQSYSVAVRANVVSKWDRSDNILLFVDEVATVFEVIADLQNPMWFKFKQVFKVEVNDWL